MAPIKFEENIKEKLEQRRLEPSQDAWASLSNRLDKESNNRNKGLFLYLGIAASIVGVLLVYSLLIKSSSEVDGIQEVVNSEINAENVTSPEQDIKNVEPQVAETSVEDINVDETPKEELKDFNIKKSTSEYVVSNTNKPKEKVQTTPQNLIINEPVKLPKAAVIANVSSNPEEKSLEKPLNKLDFESAKVLEVVTAIQKLEASGNDVTDSEIDALLKQAERDILNQRLYNETTRTVNADALLQDVEEDLEQSFRERVFQNLKSSFNSVKTAVAARNN